MIEIKHLRKEYENITPIEDITTTINKGDVISIIGPSGTGKSTLLRMINMLEKPTSGQIIIDGKDITKNGFSHKEISGKIVMVFQSFNLFNNLTVLENVCLAPIKLKGIKPSDAYDLAMKLLEEVGLGGFALSYPSSLSGGQKQRAAIARAIAMEPEIILFDEPTSALDPMMTGEIELIIKRLATKGYTMLLVTHDMDFAESVANRVIYLDEGGIYEDGTPEQIFHNQKREKTKAFVKQFKSFNGEVNPYKYDFMDLYSNLNQFVYKASMTKNIENRIKAIFEEICFQIISPNFIKNKSKVYFDISYSPIENNGYFKIKFKDIDIDLNNSEYKISLDIIKHYSESIEINQLDDGYIQYSIKI